MENTTENNNVIEVLTELNVSDVKTLNFIIDKCISVNMFADESKPVVEQLSSKLKQLIESLESSS